MGGSEDPSGMAGDGGRGRIRAARPPCEPHHPRFPMRRRARAHPEKGTFAMRILWGLLLVITLAAPLLAAGRAMTIDDLLAVKGVSDPQVSPDGRWVVYVVSELDRATDKTNSDLWLVPVAEGEPRRLTMATGADNPPRWSP